MVQKSENVHEKKRQKSPYPERWNWSASRKQDRFQRLKKEGRFLASWNLDNGSTEGHGANSYGDSKNRSRKIERTF